MGNLKCVDVSRVRRWVRCGTSTIVDVRRLKFIVILDLLSLGHYTISCSWYCLVVRQQQDLYEPMIEANVLNKVSLTPAERGGGRACCLCVGLRSQQLKIFCMTKL